MPRGYFEIGICNGKFEVNVGTLWRSAYQLGAAGIFTIGQRYKQQATDTTCAYRHIPLRNYPDFETFLKCRPEDCQLIAVEMGGIMLNNYIHPNRAIYLLGAEDSGLPEDIIAQCDATVAIEAVRTASFNVSVAGSIVMYHRQWHYDRPFMLTR